MHYIAKKGPLVTARLCYGAIEIVAVIIDAFGTVRII